MISVYQFNNYAIVEPDKRRVCEYLLQIYKVKEYSEISQKILGFLKITRPFFERVMGSEMSLLRRIIDGVGMKKLNSQIGDSEHDMVIQIIRK